MPSKGSSLLSSSSSAQPSAESAYEPFDARKRQRVAELITHEEKLLEEVAALKRSVPAKAAAEQDAQWRQVLRRDQDQLEQAVRSIRETGAEGVELQVGPMERQDGVEGGYRRAVEGLGRLKRDMPSVVAKMQRAKDAGEYVMMTGR